MRTALILFSLSVAVALAPPAAWAGSIAYIDNGEVWVASLDGAQKVRIAAPAVTLAGETETYNAVAAADGGRIVAARNKPGRISSFSWFKAWEPNGTSTVEGPLNSRPGSSLYVYPLGFDLTPDGTTMVYGYSNSNCCPYTLATGTYVRPVTNSPLEPISISGQQDPSLFGARVIAHSGSMINVQDPGTPYGTDFTPWLDTTGTGLELHGTDVAANGTVVAFEAERWNTGTKTIGRIGVVSIAGVDQGPTGAVDCYLQTAGVATEPSLSQDGRLIAWTDEQGLKIAPTPTGTDEFCVFASAPVVISATGKSGSIGGADIAAFLPPPAPPVIPPVTTTTTAPPAAPAAPVASVPSKLTTKALGAGLPLKLTLAAAGKVTISATVPAKAVGRKGKPVVVATGSGTAKAAGKLTVKLRLNSLGKKKLKRLKGVRLTLRIVQGGRTTTKTVRLS
jgi:hypothetical protein